MVIRRVELGWGILGHLGPLGRLAVAWDFQERGLGHLGPVHGKAQNSLRNVQIF